MSDAATRYEDHMRRLLDGRARGAFTGAAEADEDRLLEQMDVCWWEMTEAEQQEAERRLAEARRISAPESLGDDVALDEGDRLPPRKAA